MAKTTRTDEDLPEITHSSALEALAGIDDGSEDIEASPLARARAGLSTAVQLK
jgi:hypothetical protein